MRVCSLRVSLHRAHYGAVLESQGDGHEDEVEQEHGEPQGFVHFPAEAGDAQHDEAQHSEQDEHRACHAGAVHFNRNALDDAVQQPWQR